MSIGALALLASLAILIATSLWHHRLASRLLDRLEMAQHQALLVTRLEADLAARQLAEPVQRAVLDRAIAQTAHVYLSSIGSERRLIDADMASQSLQAQEWAKARMLVDAVHAPAPDGWIMARRLSHDIALREQEEAREAAQSIMAIQHRNGQLIWGLAIFILMLCITTGWLLWRGIVTPIAALIEGACHIAAEQQPTRVTPSGLGELRKLASHFNGMAQAIETQVTLRTTALEQANQCLRDVDGRRRLFLSKVSHELRTPVTVMRGEAEVALRRPDDRAGLEDALIHIVDSSHFLHRRLDDLLALAQAQDGALSIQPQLVDLTAILQDAHAMTGPFAAASGIDLHLEHIPENVTVMGDPDRLRQALVAVIDNGIKFSPPSGAIHLNLHTMKGAAHIAISDEGPGVPEADVQRIFDPYFRSATGRSRNGTGLGLALARWILERHDGRIAAANRPAQEGLCVSMTLPVAS